MNQTNLQYICTLDNIVNLNIFEKFKNYFDEIAIKMSKNLNKFFSDNGKIFLNNKYTKFVSIEIYADLIHTIINLIKKKYNKNCEFESNIFWIFDNFHNFAKKLIQTNPIDPIIPIDPREYAENCIKLIDESNQLFKLNKKKIVQIDLKLFLCFMRFTYADSYMDWIELNWNGFKQLNFQ